MKKLEIDESHGSVVTSEGEQHATEAKESLQIKI